MFSAALLLMVAGVGCSQPQTGQGKTSPKGTVTISEYIADKDMKGLSVATFAGGCFWCTEAAFERIAGVKDAVSGYIGGQGASPSYEAIGTGTTGHAEAVEIFYDPAQVSFEKLLEVFFVAHDPTTLNRQGPDVGTQYRSAIFYHDKAQQQAAEAYIQKLTDAGKFDSRIVTKLEKYTKFWVAEEYHQGYYDAHPENPYVQRVSRPKVEKVMQVFADVLKPEYMKR